MDKTQRICELNDLLRTAFIGGQILVTPGIAGLPDDTQRSIIEQVQTFSAFTPDNDPHGEHDFGAFTIEGQKVFWKIDYYAHDMMHGYIDPGNPAVTHRGSNHRAGRRNTKISCPLKPHDHAASGEDTI